MLRFYKNVRTCNFVHGQKILTECVFVAQLSTNAGISVRWNTWVTTHCCFRE